ncbi:MAG TPA: hypothetical protein VM911_21385 [Pyrinomonadaceae bacterium]|jgi:hypothetical protein|nr:hypothetical protein [Pyrinomonadaceae bacterium]
MTLTKILLALFLLLLSLAATCERDTRLNIESGNPPEFIMSGSGALTILRMHGPKVREGQGETAHIIWEVVPKDGAANAKGVEEIGTVIYGQIPAGYVQNYPEQGQAPTLVEGEEYDVWLITDNANGVKRHFVVRDGKILVK